MDFSISAGSLQAPCAAPQVTLNGTGYVVVWLTGVGSAAALTAYGSGIYSARVRKDGSIASGSNFEITIAANGSPWGHLNEVFTAPALAGKPRGLIAWNEGGVNGASSSITSLEASQVSPF